MLQFHIYSQELISDVLAGTVKNHTIAYAANATDIQRLLENSSTLTCFLEHTQIEGYVIKKGQNKVLNIS